MARLDVNPTRMELANLQEKLKIAKRGHKMLKDKQEALVREFMALSYRTKNLRQEVETELGKVTDSFVLSSAVTDEERLLMNLSYGQQNARTHVKSKQILNLRVPRFDMDAGDLRQTDGEWLYPYSFQSTSSDVDEAAIRLRALMPDIIKLAQFEKSCQMLSGEISATSRRVNALEFRTIVDIQDTIAYILMRIDERERNHTARLMKLQEMDPQ